MSLTNIHSQSATASAGTNGLRDIKPPIEIPSGWAWVGWGLASLALAALAFWAWRYWQKRRAQIPPVPVIPAHIRAKQELREALALIGQPREFCILVSDTVRWYLEERFDFHAPERTTEEFLYEVSLDQSLSSDHRKLLGAFLQEADLVKFAKFQPGAEERMRALEAAEKFVQESGGSANAPADRSDESMAPHEPRPPAVVTA